MPDEFYHNGLADPPAEPASSGPSMLGQAQSAVRNWWNGLGDDMRNQAGLPQSELLRRFGVSALMAPMALRAGANPTAAVDAGMARQAGRPYAPGEFPSHIMDPRVTGDVVAGTMEKIYPQSMHNFRHPDYRSHGMVALPEEVGFWAKQVPANVSDAAAMRRSPSTGDPYLDAMLTQSRRGRQGTEGERPFDVIQGDKP